MVQYKVSPTKEGVLFFQGFERELEDKVQSILTQSNPSLSCTLGLSVQSSTAGGNAPFRLNTNASFSLSGSQGVQNQIQSYLEARSPELEAVLGSAQQLLVDIQFSLKEEAQQAREQDAQFLVREPIYRFDQVILKDEIKEEIFSALSIIKNSDLIYKEWGFGEVDPIPRSVLNFFGPPGTGKTMCAHAIAHELQKLLLALNYAEIESKYVGEAPKNLVRAFDVARERDAVLFFDEADSFLGKRIQNVTQGAEQALNSLRSQMLMLLEQHSGVIVFATNLVSNFDPAFESRILKHIKFELPNQEARAYIIAKMIPYRLPLSAPLTEEAFGELSDLCDGFSGREIKGVILETLLDKAYREGAQSVFGVDDFKARFTLKKEEKERLKAEADQHLKEKIIQAISKSDPSSQEGEQGKSDQSEEEETQTEQATQPAEASTPTDTP